MNLFEITAEYQSDLAKINDLDLPPEVVMDTIEAIEAPLQDKVRSVVAFMKNLEATAEAIEAHAKTQQARAKAMRNRAESLAVYVQANLQASGAKLPMTFPEFSVNLAKLPPSVEITSVAQLPADMKRREVTIDLQQASDVEVEKQSDSDLMTITVRNVPSLAVSWLEEPRKRDVLDALKAGGTVPGARLNPVAYRLNVR